MHFTPCLKLAPPPRTPVIAASMSTLGLYRCPRTANTLPARPTGSRQTSHCPNRQLESFAVQTQPKILAKGPAIRIIAQNRPSSTSAPPLESASGVAHLQPQPYRSIPQSTFRVVHHPTSARRILCPIASSISAPATP
eukprot:CAMPEP_0206474950 /NCGR_PEP_ID=MMETSP0324_2-20121206/33794_1 /ASSEMBLY_ACC=CAM_ASM_000836 /TAXON_ID=2866 /ORGANISM="Crypthecodinium cohnii, Strain Seligo" /LENGTH=137 /DNA_ID=CAMNT_0053950225 /DNA_START=189 /DNA_END=599 /DNA_ORIENTATION=+